MIQRTTISKAAGNVAGAFFMMLFIASSAFAQKDYGDAPDTGVGTGVGNYKTTLLDGGPSHGDALPTLYFGLSWSADDGTLQNGDATADPSDDGISFPSTLIASPGFENTGMIVIQVAGGGVVNAFFDFNQNGSFGDVGEQVLTDVSLAVGTHNVAVTIPMGASTGTTFARFRISTAGGDAGDSGAAVDGEIEDYQVTIEDGAGSASVDIDFEDGISQPITVTADGSGKTTVSDGTTTFLSFPTTFSSTLTVTGTSADDSFVLDYANGDVSNGPIAILGMGQTTGDSMTLQNGTQATIRHTFSNENDGRVDFTAFNSIFYTGLEPITDNMSATNRDFSFSAASETISLTDSGGTNGIAFIDSDFGESVTFTVPSTSITIDGGDGDNVYDVELIDQTFGGTINIAGGTGIDDLQMSFGNGNPLMLGGITFTAADDDFFQLLPDGNNTDFGPITYDLFNHTVDVNGTTFTYTHVEPTGTIRDLLVASDRILNARAAVDTIEFSDDSTPSDGVNYFVYNGDHLFWEYAEPTSSFTVNMLADDDVVTLLQLDDASGADYVFNGGSEDDTFELKYDNGNPLEYGNSFTFNGETQTLSDLVTLSTTGPNPTNADYVYTNANDGSIDLDGFTFAYTGLEPITDNLSPTNRTFTFGATDDVIEIDDNDTPGTDTWRIFSTPATSETTTFIRPTTKLTVFGGDGDDTFNLPEIDSNVLAPSNGVHFRGGLGDDQAFVQAAEDYRVEIHGDAPTTAPGDELDLDFTNLTEVKITWIPDETGVDPLKGVYTFDHDTIDYQNVSYDLIETLHDTIELIDPLDTQTGISIEPTFEWDFAPTMPIDDFDLFVDLDEMFTAPVEFTKTAIPSASTTYQIIYDVDGFKLDNNTTYYWNVAANVTEGTDNIFCAAPWEFISIQELVPDLTYPVNGLKIYDTDFDFSWNVAAAAPDTEYLLEVVESPNTIASGPWKAQITTGDTDYPSAGMNLFGGRTYTWRITAMTSDGRTIAISDEESFQIAGGAIVPTPSYPVGGLEIYTNDVLFSWWVGAPFQDLTFDLEYRNVTESEPFTGTPDVSGITGLQTLVTGLDQGDTYEWRIRSKHTNGDVSAWSTAAMFKIHGAVSASSIHLTYPVDGLKIYETAPTFHWNVQGPATGLSFLLQVYEDGGPLVGSATVSNQTQAQITGLIPGEDYEWKVTVTSITPNVVSATETFSIAGGSGTTSVIQSWPIGNPTMYSLTPTLNWYLSGSSLGLEDYTVQVDDDPGFGSPDVSITTSNTFYTVPANTLSYGTTYYWRVKANFDDATSTAYDPDSFTVIGALGTLVPQLAHPVGGLIIPGDQTTLSWYITGSGAAVDHYEVQYSTASLFWPTLTTTETTTETQLEIDNLIPGAIYYWRVRANNGTGYTAYSTVESFVVPAGAAPVTPRVGSPVAGITIADSAPVFSWFDATESTSDLTYEFEYGTDPELTNATVVSNLDEAQVSGLNLEPGTYYWRARSLNSDGMPSTYSDVAEFTTLGLSVGVEDDPGVAEELPGDFRLNQNYPNPFNPTTTIEFNLPQTGHVSIRVYNVLGQVVKTLVDGEMAAGTHNVKWDARDSAGTPVSSGIYLYRMEAGSSFKAVRTLVLMK